MERRKFLKIIGGGVVLAAASGAAFSLTRTPTHALQPWQDAGTLYTESRKRALSYAILSPNPHNRQPWKIDLSVADQVTIYPDLERMLPHTDPYNRQITIGFGCFLETLRMAASEDGYEARTVIFPDGSNAEKLDARAIAKISFTKNPDAAKDMLFAQVPLRRSLKEPFDLSKPVARDTLDQLLDLSKPKLAAGTTSEKTELDAMRTLTRDALQIEIDTPRTYKESVDLFRIGKSEVNANPDGIDFSGPLFEGLAMVGQFSRELALDRESSAYLAGIEAVLKNTDSAMGYVWITSTSNTREEQILAGRDWVRINLAATQLGLGVQPLSQALQEYREMKPWYDAVHEKLAPSGGTVQMLARIGYAKPVAPSPRWKLDQKLL